MTWRLPVTRKPLSFRPQLTALEDRCLLSFGSPITTSVNSPTALVTADVNGDGKLDAITLSNALSIQVWLGKGNGHFALTSPNYGPGGGNTATALAVADVNGDGRLDIVTANNPGDGSAFGIPASISVLLGNGNGTFSPAAQTYYVLPSIATSLSVGDFNGDGKIDLVAGGYNSISVLLNQNGSQAGIFPTAQNYPIPAYASSPAAVAVGDINGDGKLDIVAVDGTVNVLLNNGTGTFQSAQSYTVGGYAVSVAVGDVNGDGKPDMVTANGTNNTVSLLLNKGDGSGTFGAPQTYALGGAANSVAVGDVNGDGKLDIVTAGAQLKVLLNNGNGTFGAAQNVGPAGSSVIVGDFNGDGWLDLAQIDAPGSSIDVLLNKADWQRKK